jgi:hypothetical protein
MPRRVKTLRPGLSLPDGNIYPQINMVVELTDAQYLAIDDAVFTGGYLQDLGPSSVSTPAPVDLPYAATLATDASQGGHFRAVLTGNTTIGLPTNLTDGQKILWQIAQDATGGRTVGLNASFNLGGLTTSWSTAANKIDYLGAIYRAATGKLDVIAFSAGY